MGSKWRMAIRVLPGPFTFTTISMTANDDRRVSNFACHEHRWSGERCAAPFDVTLLPTLLPVSLERVRHHAWENGKFRRDDNWCFDMLSTGTSTSFRPSTR